MVAKKAFPSSKVSAVNVACFAVGMLCRCINALAKSLLPSNAAAAFCGPITGTDCNAVSFKK